MKTEDIGNNISEPIEEGYSAQRFSIDKMLKAMKKYKRKYIIGLPLAFFLTAFYALGLPNYFTVTVKLAPEISGRSRTRSLSSLFSSFGVTSNNAIGEDAIFPTLYPEMMNSVNFQASLFPILIHRVGETEMTTYYDYLKDGQKTTWWSDAISGVSKAIFSLFGNEEEETEADDFNNVNTFKLTKTQALICKAIAKKVVCDVDKKTLVITINVTDQDPLIAATIADSVQQHLQHFITNYRTNKARVDVEHYKRLLAEAKVEYEKALKDYATFSDANQRVHLQSVRTIQAQLEMDLGLKQNVYSQMSSQLQVAEAKLQEETPAFTTLQPATVPVRKAGPSRAKMCLVMMFLTFLGITVWVLHKEDLLKPLLGLGDGDEDEE